MTAATPRTHFAAHLLLVLSVLLWAGNWALARALRFEAPPVALAFWRWATALVILLAIAWPHLRRQWRAIARAWKILLLLGVLATALQHIPIYVGLQHTTATNAALLYSTSPVFILIVARIVLGERIGARGIAGIAASLAGALALITRADWQVLRAVAFNVGDFWALLASAAWAVYTVCLRWRPEGLHPIAALTALSAAGLAAMLPLYAWEIAAGRHLQVTAATLLGIGYLGLFATVLAYLAWNRGVQQVGAVRSGAYMYLLPVFAALLSMIFLGETLHAYHLLGVALILGGIWLSSRRTPRL